MTNTTCPKIGAAQWSCSAAECTCHLKSRVIEREQSARREIMDLLGAQHWYVYSHIVHGIPVYDRTCGSEAAAARWVVDYRSCGMDAFYTRTNLKHRYY